MQEGAACAGSLLVPRGPEASQFRLYFDRLVMLECQRIWAKGWLSCHHIGAGFSG